MNVSSGTGSPGLSRTKGRKTVVVVVVVVGKIAWMLRVCLEKLRTCSLRSRKCPLKKPMLRSAISVSAFYI